jgi:hypothetical protein
MLDGPPERVRGVRRLVDADDDAFHASSVSMHADVD